MPLEPAVQQPRERRQFVVSDFRRRIATVMCHDRNRNTSRLTPASGPERLVPMSTPGSAAVRQNAREIVIVGGGFAGMGCARALAGSPALITLIDRRNFHLFQPLLYQVALGGLSPANIAAPLRGIFRSQRNVRVLMADVTGFELDPQRVLLADGGSMPFDTLVIAGGSRHHYFGHDADWQPLAPGLKTLEDATRIRCDVLNAFERAERAVDPAAREALLTFVVVGGGPTGVEMAGAICELARDTLRREFRSIDPSAARIILVESGDRLLDSFAPDLADSARRALERLGVEILWGHRVVDIRSGHVVVRDKAGGERRIEAETIVWAAGVRASDLGSRLAAALGHDDLLDRVGRVKVDTRCQIPGFDSIYVLGDLAAFPTDDGSTLPGVAPVAMQQGEWVGRRIARSLAGRALEKRFRYRDRGSMATIGRSQAIVQLGWLRLSGRIAWLLWLFVHILNLAKFENRVLVLIQWLWNYVTRNRSARLITGATSPDVPTSLS